MNPSELQRDNAQYLWHPMAHPRAMKAEGVAVLLSEQNWAFAARISDKACVIERGEIRFQGSMAELMADEALRTETLGV